MTVEDPLNLILALATICAAKFIAAALLRKKKVASFEYVGQVSILNIHPVKSCAPISLQSVVCTKDGLSYRQGFVDRNWMVVGENGSRVNIQQEPKMNLIRQSIIDNVLYLDAPGMPTLKLEKNLPTDASLFINCTVHGMAIVGMSCGQKASNWISQYLGTEGLYIVVSTTQMEKRNICDMNTKPWVNSPNTDDKVTFSEVGICNIASESSLQDLNSRLAIPVVMGNFRPTIVVKGCLPFEEDTWREIKIGSSVYMRILEPNPRCLLITVDPNGRRDPGIEPLKTLRKFRKSPLYGDSPLFGVTTAVDHGGVINVGDPVYVLRKE